MKRLISDITESDRPREKLLQKGAEALSDLELMAILLGRGIKDHDVLTVADRILKALDGNKGQVNLEERINNVNEYNYRKITIEIKRPFLVSLQIRRFLCLSF